MPVPATRNPTDKPIIKIRVSLYSTFIINVVGFKVSGTMLWSSMVRLCLKGMQETPPEAFLEATTLIRMWVGEVGGTRPGLSFSELTVCEHSSVGVVPGHWLCECPCGFYLSQSFCCFNGVSEDQGKCVRSVIFNTK